MKITLNPAEAEQLIKSRVEFGFPVDSVEIKSEETPKHNQIEIPRALIMDLRVASKNGNKIAMIKAIRTWTGCSLIDGRDFVEAFFEGYRRNEN